MPNRKLATVNVERIRDGLALRFNVSVREGSTATRHEVTMGVDMMRRLAQGRSAEEVIEAAFRFLLEREPKELILARFDASVIARYFPEFERELPNYLARR
jgi:hypothetical protein